MHRLKLALVAATALGGAALLAPAANAIPMSGLAGATEQLSTDIQQARWVCGPYRCWWRPNYWGYRRWGWGPRWGWRRW